LEILSKKSRKIGITEEAKPQKNTGLTKDVASIFSEMKRAGLKVILLQF